MATFFKAMVQYQPSFVLFIRFQFLIVFPPPFRSLLFPYPHYCGKYKHKQRTKSITNSKSTYLVRIDMEITRLSISIHLAFKDRA